MQPYRITTRALPRACKATCPSPAKRTLFTTPFFPPSSISSDLAPLFRLLDSATADLVPSTTSRAARRTASFTPRFDVRELGSQYELQGELPGIEQKDLQIEFVDERTLVIRGRTTQEYSSGQNGDDATSTTKAVEAGDKVVDNAEEKTANSNYRRPSVQEEDSDYVDAGAEAASAPKPNPSQPTTELAEQTTQQQSKDVSSASEQPNFKYWISERSVGEFERRFSFPGRVDQDAVKASLKNGILSVVVPKIVRGETRRIQIE